MSRELAAAIETVYCCRVVRCKPKRTVWLCDTDRGSWVVKGYDDFNKAVWVTRLAHTLHQRGFTDVVRYVPTVQHVPVFKWNDQYMTAMQRLPGREGSFVHLSDIIHSLRKLAEFHLYSASIPGGPPPDPGIPLIVKWEKRYQSFLNIYQQLQNEGERQGRLAHLVRTGAPAILREADYVLNIARNSALTAEYTRSFYQQHIAHKDVASHNFLICGTQTSIIDLDTAGYDTPLTDIIQLISRALVLQGWRGSVFNDAIDAYRRIRPLSREQVALIFLMLRFPDNFMREVTGVYERKRSYQASRVEQYLSIVMKNWNRRERFFTAYEQFLYA
ncbi:phosphotransferase [Aneurinibacillus sp. BA2021]|nr:phosphotransferase [Aneurinibacillus sp. BA2021]